MAIPDSPEYEATKIGSVAFCATGDLVKVDNIWWEIIERLPVTNAGEGSGSRWVLLRVDADHVETHVMLNSKTILVRKRIWDT